MKSMKHIALGIVVTLSVFCAVLYTSCSKDGCKGVTCLNGGVCSGGICNSCPTGTGGSNCQTIYRSLYLHTYSGNAIYNYLDSTSHVDTGVNTLTFTAGADSLYAQMSINWVRPGRSAGTAQISLDTSTANGSTFHVSFAIDTFTYVGTGSVNATTASMNLTEMHDSIVSGTVTLSNFTRQQ
jgi:hypothetical protein